MGESTYLFDRDIERFLQSRTKTPEKQNGTSGYGSDENEHSGYNQYDSSYDSEADWKENKEIMRRAMDRVEKDISNLRNAGVQVKQCYGYPVSACNWGLTIDFNSDDWIAC